MLTPRLNSVNIYSNSPPLQLQGRAVFTKLYGSIH